MSEPASVESTNQIKECIVHKLVKVRNQTTSSVEPRQTLLSVNKSVQLLVDTVYKMYSDRTGKGYGQFEADEENFPTQKYIKHHVIDKSKSFVELTETLMRKLAREAAGEYFATGGYVFFAKVTVNAHEYLLITMITEVIGAAISSELEVTESIHLELQHLKVAGRIDLTTWLNGGERYISFLKGKTDVAEYFKTFIGCNDILKPVEETKQLVGALEDFATDLNMTPGDRGHFLESAYSFLKGIKKNQPISLDALANHVWPDEPEKLKTKLADEKYRISDGFIPDGRSYRGLITFAADTKLWKLSFSRDAILDGSVMYDRSNNKLTLSNVPAELREKLLEETRDDDE